MDWRGAQSRASQTCWTVTKGIYYVDNKVMNRKEGKRMEEIFKGIISGERLAKLVAVKKAYTQEPQRTSSSKANNAKGTYIQSAWRQRKHSADHCITLLIAQLEWVNFMICNLYHNKTVKNESAAQRSIKNKCQWQGRKATFTYLREAFRILPRQSEVN